MATFTSRRNFKKPGSDDPVSITDINNNFDLVDSSLNYIVGMEYLKFYHNKLRNGTAAKIVFSGDSTTAGGLMDATMDTNYYIDKLSEKLLRDKGIHQVTTVNAGHSGATATDWVNTSGADYLTADLAQSPDLYVIRFGINDVWLSDPLATFETAMTTGLTRIRAAKTANEMSVIVMMPTKAINPLTTLDEDWYDGVYSILVALANEFQCVFVDTYHFLLDASNVKWTDQFTFSEETLRVHPDEVGNSWIISLLSPCLCPEALHKPTQIDLLWENPDVTVAYTSGTLTLPKLAQYDAIMVAINFDKTLESCGAPLLLKVGQSGLATAVTGYIAWRIFQFYDSTTVAVQGGNVNITYATPTANDDYAIPVRIYGVRNIGSMV